MKEYIHKRPGEEAQVGPWPCRVVEECRMAYDGGEVLYIIGDASVGSSCVGAGTLRYIQVPGIIARWRFRPDNDGNMVSAVMPVTDSAARAAIQEILLKKNPGLQVCF